MTTDSDTSGPAAAEASSAPLDLLLTDAAFADPGWAGNPLPRRVMQAHLAAAAMAEGLAADADLEWADAQRAGFVLRNLIDALAPSSNPVLNPAALKAAIDTGGGSVLAGLRPFASDMAAPPRVPELAEPAASEVGTDLAVAARITRTEQTAIMGCCSGGILSAMVAAHLAAATSAARGYLDGRSLAEVFAWLRPGDLVWNYWVNDYLLGRTPPVDLAAVDPDTYLAAKETPGDPEQWLRRAEDGHGSWWPDHASWLAGRCGEETAAPGELGGGGLEPIGDAPGAYIYDR